MDDGTARRPDYVEGTGRRDGRVDARPSPIGSRFEDIIVVPPNWEAGPRMTRGGPPAVTDDGPLSPEELRFARTLAGVLRGILQRRGEWDDR